MRNSTNKLIDAAAIMTDVGGVLNRTAFSQFDQILAEQAKEPVETVRRTESTLRHELDAGGMTVEAFVKAMNDELSLSYTPSEYKTLLREHVTWYKEIIEEYATIEKPTYILSNNSALFIDEATRSFLNPAFDKQFYSHILEVRKPHPGIYEHVLSNVEEPPEKIVFIDDKQRNLDAATNFGLQTNHSKNPYDTYLSLRRL